ncbi:MAG: addiction module protein, partial [Sphingobacteriales bacterium 39-40-5]
YYQLLQKVRSENVWEEWILFILDGIEQTSLQTISLIQGIKDLMLNHKHKMRSETKFYSQDLLNNIFRHPYSKIDFVMKDLAVSRPTATKYLEELVAIGILKSEKIWKENYYINVALFDLLANVNTKK